MMNICINDGVNECIDLSIIEAVSTGLCRSECFGHVCWEKVLSEVDLRGGGGGGKKKGNLKGAGKTKSLWGWGGRGPQNNRNLNVARELEVFARCAARCRESTQYSNTLPRGVSLG
jgi:hypothetical protein